MATKKPKANPDGTLAISIPAPNFQTAKFRIRGTSAYVQCKFSQKAQEQIIATQEAGSTARGKKKAREAKDFTAAYEGSMHRSTEGWHGIPASAFRNAMISACRTVGYTMTHAKLAVFIEADGTDRDDQMPLVRLVGTPHRHIMHVRNATGVIDMRARAMFDAWHADVRVRFDADMMTARDVANLLMRAGAQVGIGEGRPDSRQSNGLGWGFFAITAEEIVAAALAAPADAQADIKATRRARTRAVAG